MANGDGVLRDGIEQPGPNFAEHYIGVTWRCGSPRGMMAIVDALTGKVYNPPLAEDLDLPSLYQEGYFPSVADVEFRQNSALMIVKANPNPMKERNQTHYFLWENSRWKLLRRILMEPNEP